MTGLRFTPETGMHAPRLRCSAFCTSPGRWILRLVTANGAGGDAEYPTQAAAMAGIPALYAELTAQHTVPTPSEQIVTALLPGYAPS